MESAVHPFAPEIVAAPFGQATSATRPPAQSVHPDLERYLTALFAGCAGFVEFRGLGEPDKKLAPIRVWSPIGPGLAAAAAGFIQRCDRTGHAAYVIPSTFAQPVAKADGEGYKEAITQVPAIVADLDSGDVAAKFARAVEALGPPTMVVESGGTTAEGQIKLHLYWRLAEPATDGRLAEVQELRKQLAIAIGSDRSLQRIAQPIRLPTSTHRKDPANPRPVILTVCAANSYPFSAMHEAIGALAPAPAEQAGGIDLNQYRQGPSTAELRVGHVGTEGKSGITRWEALSQVIGSELANARAGLRTVTDAQSVVKGWVKTCLEKPADWDDERVEYEFNRLLNIDVKKYGAFQALPVQPFGGGGLGVGQRAPLVLRDFTARRYGGALPPRRWLVEGSLPLGVPAMLFAAGNVGKSMLALDLALRVATGGDVPPGAIDLNSDFILGGRVVAHGTAVVLTAEDDEREISERLTNLDPQRRRDRHPDRLVVVPLASAGGVRVIAVPGRQGPEVTAEFESLRQQLREIPDLRLIVIDPLSSFVAVDINSDPLAGAFVCAMFGQLAAETGATVLVLHHTTKGDNEGRDAARGTSALTDGVRWAYHLWIPRDAEAKAKELGVEFAPNGIATGHVVKANGPSDRRKHDYVRQRCGVLRQYQDTQLSAKPDRDELLALLVADLTRAAAAGHPFTVTGQNGLGARRSALSESLSGFGHNRLEMMANELIADRRIVKCSAPGTKLKQYLDAPNGDFAKGHGEFIPGADPTVLAGQRHPVTG